MRKLTNTFLTGLETDRPRGGKYDHDGPGPGRRLGLAALAALTLVTLVPHTVLASPGRIEISRVRDARSGQEVEVVSGELLVRFRAGTPEQRRGDCLRRNGLARGRSFGDGPAGTSAERGERVAVPPAVSLEQLLAKLRLEKEIALAEPNFILRATNAATGTPEPAALTSPNDPLYPQQWGLAAIGAPAAWTITRGDPSVIVAVIDTGIDPDHPDLRDRLVPGRDFVDGTADPRDDNGHGTFCAGIIGAEADNGIGIAGVAPRVSLMSLKALDGAGEGTTSTVAEAIVWAADHGARVVNLSLGSPAFSQFLQEAVDYALGKGCVLVAAGGNDGVAAAVYPAAYPEVIGVGATGQGGAIWRLSNTGSHIALVAPGEAIVSTGLLATTVSNSGTSAASAFVAGVAALVVSARPELSGTTVGRLLAQTAHDLGAPGRDPVYGSGGIDAASSLTANVRPVHDVALREFDLESPTAASGQPFTFVATAKNVGTYRGEACDVRLYRVLGTVRRLVQTVSSVSVESTTKVTFAWLPEDLRTQLEFVAAADCAGDENPSNDERRLSLSTSDQGGVVTLYKNNPFVHSWLTYQAIQAVTNPDLRAELTANFWGGSTACSLFGVTFDGTGAWTWCGDGREVSAHSPPAEWTASSSSGTSIAEGAWEEDMDDYGVCEAMRSANFGSDSSQEHFWDPDAGWDVGLGEITRGGISICGSNHSALNRANQWWQKAKTAYSSTTRPAAYYWLGRVAHLISDMGVPEHAHNDPHPGKITLFGLSYHDFSNYEELTALTYREYPKARALPASPPVTLPDTYVLPDDMDRPLATLFYNLAESTQFLDSSNVIGEGAGWNGQDLSALGMGSAEGGGTKFDYRAMMDLSLRVDPATVPTVVWKRCNLFGCSDSTSLAECNDPAVEECVDFARGAREILIPDTLYRSLGWLDVIEASYSSGGASYTDSVRDLTSASPPYAMVPDRLANRQADGNVPKTISYVAALYQLFWDETRPCSYSAGPLALKFGSAWGTQTVAITTGATCGWAWASDASWINANSVNSSGSYRASGSGTGSSTLGIQVLTNRNAASRTGTITIAGQVITVVQDGTGVQLLLPSEPGVVPRKR